jgi:hypothetical protein
VVPSATDLVEDFERRTKGVKQTMKLLDVELLARAVGMSNARRTALRVSYSATNGASDKSGRALV